MDITCKSVVKNMATERKCEFTSDKFNVTMMEEEEHEEARNTERFETDSVKWTEQFSFQISVQYSERYFNKKQSNRMRRVTLCSYTVPCFDF